MKRQRRILQSPARDGIRDFLDHNRALGKRFDSEEWTLGLFDSYLVEQQIQSLSDITPVMIENFLSSRPRKAAKSYNQLLGVVRRWFTWMVMHERVVQSPVCMRSRRVTATRTPFLFEPADICRLLAAAAQLPDGPHAQQRGLVYSTVFALCYALGLRVGEATRLRLQDIDWERNILTVHETKFFKSRLVPFGPKLAARLANFLQDREQVSGRLAPEHSLFCLGKDQSRPLSPRGASKTFTKICSKLNFHVAPGVASPRLHSLRHSFAVTTLLHWYQQGIDPQERLLSLSTFLGHVHPSSTAVYLTITADLCDQASQRFERFAAPLVKEVTS